MILQRLEFRSDGIFSNLLTDDCHEIADALEHAYQDESGAWRPKIPNGTFTCVRGKHRLHPDSEEFETFEITGVPGHDGLLFHRGNWEDDSKGCVCLGERIQQSDRGQMVVASRDAFRRFMEAHEGVQEFTLTVR